MAAEFDKSSLAHLTIEQSPDGVFILDFDGKLHYANPAACAITGYSLNELLAVPRGRLDLEREEADVLKDLRSLREVKANLREGNLLTKDGRVVPVEMHSTYLNLSGRDYACAYIRDISAFQAINQELNAALDQIKILNQRLRDENIYLRDEIHHDHNFSEIITEDPGIQKVLSQVEQVAKSDATVLILGETGTGKELFARMIHALSPRAANPLVKVNCTALSPNLVESDLFGHEKGSFTGAHMRKLGRFELADKSTIFLDEIGDFPLDLQPKLLRALQEGEFERVGGVTPIKVDARIVAATNRNLQRALQDHTFREDLFYRLSVFPIKIPPLRERKADIPLLAKHFLKRFGRSLGKSITDISPAFMKKLVSYSWPGNIRELENVIERATILCSEASLDMQESLSLFPDAEIALDQVKTIREAERTLIIKSLAECDGVIEGPDGAAAALGIAPSTLRERLKKYQIQRPD